MVELRNNIRGSANVRLVDFHILTHSQTLLRRSFFPRDFSMWGPRLVVSEKRSMFGLPSTLSSELFSLFICL